ncbi:flagellar basal body rod protein FlgB [Clostridium septicum]|uniref:Flagellar basal body rod protein FlgB n=1 Tax=Clostridium septicum TaxID=1504 RepID=A0A9N7PI84_CLOSE|nr:flagellar basal body rod protein FlgB [Clostridium septicum]AYE33435.1 flagellar basal body rod protein FlgB [Clostridium septicum]MDU1313955.1 flagellar basal body rod protein FlgB [Clostridium septicum]QAS61609.1 flagellar basal body rod protein FlgB [Clostridium septicum]UEC21955.1 flagellar basal body rod protein FlgB [Clostridium septicum]USS00014.1 flagellar basal body rod protein FlgB [Clostridium septicum]
MNFTNDSTFSFIKRGLDVATLKGKVISNNLANINTKGYKKFSVDFKENLEKQSEGFNLKKTNVKHIGGELQNGDISVKRDKSTSMRMDGNNVDLDLEKVNQAANTLMYNALITQANSKMNMTKTVISGGVR